MSMPMNTQIPTGWQCPVCRRIWAPYKDSCACSQDPARYPDRREGGYFADVRQPAERAAAEALRPKDGPAFRPAEQPGEAR